MKQRLWTPKQGICIDCRTLATTDADCSHGQNHSVVAIDKLAGRRTLLERVWGKASLRKGAAKAGATGGTTSSLLSGCGDCGGCDAAFSGESIVVFLVAAALFSVGYLLIKGLIGLIRWRRDIMRPQGACSMSPTPPATGMMGTIESIGRASPAPLSRWPCVAHATELGGKTSMFRSGVMLRDCDCVGFDLRLDTGELVAIPAGEVILSGARAKKENLIPAQLDVYLSQIDPLRNIIDDLDPFPVDHFRQRLLCHGDRVEVLTPLIAKVDAKAAHGSYRESSSVLVPKGTPALRLVLDGK